MNRTQFLSYKTTDSHTYHTSKIKSNNKILLMKTHHKAKLLQCALNVPESFVTANDFQAIYAFISSASNGPIRFSEWNKKRSVWINLELIKQNHMYFINTLGKSLWEFTQAFEVCSSSLRIFIMVLISWQKLTELMVADDGHRTVIHTPSWRIIRDEDEQHYESECSEDTSDEWYNELHDRTLLQLKERFKVLNDI